MNIIEPTQREKDAAIHNILAQGLVRPKNLVDHLVELNRVFGLRYAFWDTTQAMIMSILSFGVCSLAYAFWDTTNALIRSIFSFSVYSVPIPLGHGQFSYTILFALSPVLFIFTFLFTETIERLSGLYELKMTCKYTVQKLMAFRIVFLSLAGMLLCVAMSLFVGWSDDLFGFIKALSISLSALFLYSFLSVFVLRLSANKWIGLSVMGMWVSLILPIRIFGLYQWELFLAGLPIGITIATAMIGLLLLLNEISILMKSNQREVIDYAGS